MTLHTPDSVKERLRAAADALRRLPGPSLKQRITAWPAVLINLHEGYGYNEVSVRHAVPTGQEIDDMDEVLESWLPLLKPLEMRFIWAVANGCPWWVLAGKWRRSERTMKRKYDLIVGTLANRLNENLFAGVDSQSAVG